MDSVKQTTVRRPPSRGPGSGKDAWVQFAENMAETNGTLWDVVDRQSRLIAKLQGEVELLRRQVAERKPPGRARTPDAVVARIERDLAAGLSQRETGRRHGVSAMTVSRVARRVAERAALLQTKAAAERAGCHPLF